MSLGNPGLNRPKWTKNVHYQLFAVFPNKITETRAEKKLKLKYFKSTSGQLLRHNSYLTDLKY